MCNEKQPKSSLSLNGGMQNDGKDVKLKNSLLNPKLQSNNLNPPAVEEDALKNTKGITNNDNASSSTDTTALQNVTITTNQTSNETIIEEQKSETTETTSNGRMLLENHVYSNGTVANETKYPDYTFF